MLKQLYCVLIHTVDIYRIARSKKILIPFFNSMVKAGFPSPADDYISEKLDLNNKFITRPNSTFAVCVDGESMTGAGILPKDFVLVDRSEPVKDGSIILALVGNEFTLKRYKKIKGNIFLVPGNPNFETINEGNITLEIKSEQKIEA